MTPNDRRIAFSILAILNGSRKEHKLNIIGRKFQSGGLEAHLGGTFSDQQRVAASRIFETLKLRGLLEPTYDDIADPENWVAITDAGRQALAREALDDLDEALVTLAPHFVNLRDGVHERLSAGGADAGRQAANSLRELIDHVLRTAPDDSIRAQQWFSPDKTSRDGITRAHRLKFLQQNRTEPLSEGELELTKCLLRAMDVAVASVHAAKDIPIKRVRIALEAAELALRTLLV